MDINAVMKEYYDELFDGDSDSEESFKNKLYKVIRKARKAKSTHARREKDDRNEKDSRSEKYARSEEDVTRGQEAQEEPDEQQELQEKKKPDATQFRLPFDN